MGRVQDLEVGEQGLVARVRGGRRKPYPVRIEWTHASVKGILTAACECPRFRKGSLCQHVWAALFALEKCAPDAVPGDSRLKLYRDASLLRREVGTRVASNLPAFRSRSARIPQDSRPTSRKDLDDDWDDTDDEGDESDEGEGDDDGDDDGVAWRGAKTGSLEEIYRSVAEAITGRRTRGTSKRSRPEHPDKLWRRDLETVRLQGETIQEALSHVESVSKARQAWYVLDVPATSRLGHIQLHVHNREMRRDGALGVLKSLKVSRPMIDSFFDPADREVLAILLGVRPEDAYGYGWQAREQESARFQIGRETWDVLLPRICATCRFVLREHEGAEPELERPLAWDAGEPWRFHLRIQRDPEEAAWRIDGILERENERLDLAEPVLLLQQGLVLRRNSLARLDPRGFEWVALLRTRGSLLVPVKQEDRLVEKLGRMPDLPAVHWPEEMTWKTVRAEPRGRIEISSAGSDGDEHEIRADLAVDYGGTLVDPRKQEAGVIDAESRTLWLRDTRRERELRQELAALRLPGARTSPFDPWEMRIPRRHFAPAAQALLRAGWQVQAHGRSVRQVTASSFRVRSGIDWFELEGRFDFDGVSASLPALLSALERGEAFVQLGDGSQGMLPEEWLARFAPVVGFGEVQGDSVRFVRSQAAFLDALLASQPEVAVDEVFARVRDQLRSFDGIRAREAPAGFEGELRGYQCLGLGWLEFLREFGFGGCLADDMGLGKTVQVLALLQALSGSRNPGKGQPSLVVVPRSLVHNWIEEAERFTPGLRLLDYTGIERHAALEGLDAHDLIVTTYGTVRRDIARLKDVRFEYAILDEAQAIKNPASQSAKACRLLSARHRLALTGTPVENHLGDLWSIFEFLNPRMLGSARVFRDLDVSGERGAESGLLARALRPFLLRRTKENVLKELPEKMEQTLQCEMEPKQRRLYVELRDHYRAILGRKIEETGLGRAKIHVLEALLRLRQAACHPGLVDRGRVGEPSAKLEALVEQLQEVLAEGHKALVFSQFTRFLAIVRDRLDAQGITYEYLDGRTRDRKSKVDHFQEDPACRLFLISLRAGGQGLNLTAADYVFILDPWWNPAVEAQAIDRVHRIGQSRRVFAYRLICRDTVEEKILELQAQKRQLADSILTEDASLLRNLTAEDLQLLLS